jgi:4-amino-4-deoxychorismate lyase
MTRVWLLDGLREVPADAPVIRADDLGFVRGESVFETLRVVDGRPRFLEEHLARMATSAARVGLELGDFAALAVRAAEGHADAGLRLTMTKGGVGVAVDFAIAPETVAGRAGITVVSLPLGIASDYRAGQPWALGGVKSTSYAVNMAASRYAHELGADDAIWTSTDGFVLEAPTSTVIALVDGGWVTPPAATGILPGTTLLACQRLTEIAVAPLPVAALAQADEVALLSSVRGVAPVTRLDGRELGVGPRAADLGAALEETLHRS